MVDNPYIFRRDKLSPMAGHCLRSRWLDIDQVLFLQCPVILTEKASSIKDLFLGFRENFSPGTRRVVLSGKDCSILSALVANQRARFGSSCPPYNKNRYTIAMYYRTRAWKHRGDCSLCMHTQMYLVLGPVQTAYFT